MPWAGWAVAALAVLAAIVWTVVPFLRWWTTTYTFTDRRIITRRGIITKSGHDLPLSRINNVAYARSLSDRVFGCGSLELTTAADEPVVLDDIWLPGDLFKGLTAELLTQHRGPFYGLFEAEFGVHMIRAEEKIRALAADAASAPLLAVAPGFPLLSVERLSFTYGDKPVELRRGLYNTEQHFYRNELS